MATIWTFGDSFTDFYYPPTSKFRHWRHEYVEWKGYNPKVYGEIIAETLNMNLINKGKGGCSNSYILEEFCKVCNQIKKDDIVIFGWTSQQRFRLPDKNNHWIHFNVKPDNEDGFFMHGKFENFEILSKSTIIETLINRSGPLYSTELCNWIKLINFTLKDIQVFHWSWYNYYGVCGIYQSKEYKIIRDETNGAVDDGHWSEEGHYDFANVILNRINNGLKNLI